MRPIWHKASTIHICTSISLNIHTYLFQLGYFQPHGQGVPLVAMQQAGLRNEPRWTSSRHKSVSEANLLGIDARPQRSVYGQRRNSVADYVPDNDHQRSVHAFVLIRHRIYGQLDVVTIRLIFGSKDHILMTFLGSEKSTSTYIS